MWHQVIDLFSSKQAGIAGTIFFYRAGYRTGWADRRTKTNVTPKDIHAFFFLVVGDSFRCSNNSTIFPQTECVELKLFD
jgi:hypothetical protein